MIEERKTPKALWLILASGAVARLILWVGCAGLPLWPDDESDYNALAVRLVEQGAYCDAEGRLTSLRPPLYPAFVAGVYWVFGTESYQAVRVLQAAVSLASVTFAYGIGVKLYSHRVGLWASWICCFYPTLLVYNNLLLSEVLFTFLLTGACWSIVRALQNSRMAGFILPGALLGLAALTRSVVWLSPLCLTMFILLFWRVSPVKRLGASITLCMAFAVVVAPWSVRNTRIHKTFTAIDVMGGRNFMMGNYEHTPLHRSWAAISIEGERAWYRVLSKQHGPLQGKTQGQIDKLAMKVGAEFVRQHPMLTMKRDAVKFLDFWQLEREVLAGASKGRFGALPRWTLLSLAALVLGAYVVCVITAIFGAIMAPPADWRCHLFLILVAAFICGLHTLVFGHSRYHLPLIPILSVYSATAIVHYRQIWHRRADWRFGVACAIGGAAIAAWGYEIVAADLGAFKDAISSIT